MWYFAWILGLGFAVLLALVNALWMETQDVDAPADAIRQKKTKNQQ